MDCLQFLVVIFMRIYLGFNLRERPEIEFSAFAFAFEAPLERLLSLLLDLDGGLKIQGFLVLFLFLHYHNLFSILSLLLYFLLFPILFSFLLIGVHWLFIILLDFVLFKWMLVIVSFLFNVVQFTYQFLSFYYLF